METAAAAPEIVQVGTVEVLRLRAYPLDIDSPQPRRELMVSPGVYPLYREGDSYFWLQQGTLNRGRIASMGDGMFLASSFDIISHIPVSVPSRIMGPDDLAEWRQEEICQEGHPQQRLRVTLTEPIPQT